MASAVASPPDAARHGDQLHHQLQLERRLAASKASGQAPTHQSLAALSGGGYGGPGGPHGSDDVMSLDEGVGGHAFEDAGFGAQGGGGDPGADADLNHHNHHSGHSELQAGGGEGGEGDGEGDGAAGQGGGGGGVDGGGPGRAALGGGGAAAQGPVTPTIAGGLVGMAQRRAAIEQQIDDLTAVALEYLDSVKKDFVERMTRLKSEVGGYCGNQEGAWRDTNGQTQEALGRLANARQLVRSLGLSAEVPEGAEGGPAGALLAEAGSGGIGVGVGMGMGRGLEGDGGLGMGSGEGEQEAVGPEMGEGEGEGV